MVVLYDVGWGVLQLECSIELCCLSLAYQLSRLRAIGSMEVVIDAC